MRTPLFLLSLSAFVLFGAGCTVDPPPTAALIKASGPAVYSFADGKRYSFPNEAVYFSWSEDFEDVKTVSDATLASLPLAGNVTFRPGTLLKIETDPKVYVVDRMNRIRWISSEELAVALFGEAWAKSVHDVSDALFTGYVVDTPVASEEDETSFDDPPDDYHSLLFDLRSESRKDAGKTLPHMTSFSFTESSEYHYAATTTATDEEVWAWVDSLSNGWTEQYVFDQSDASSTSLVRTYSMPTGTWFKHRVVSVGGENGADERTVHFYELPFSPGYLAYPRSATNLYRTLDTDAARMFVTEDAPETVFGWYETNVATRGWEFLSAEHATGTNRQVTYRHPGMDRQLTVMFVELLSTTGTNIFTTSFGATLPEEE